MIQAISTVDLCPVVKKAILRSAAPRQKDSNLFRVVCSWHALLFAVTLLACLTLCGEESHTLESNVQYRLSWGDLGPPSEIVTGPADASRTLRMATGAEALLKDCLDNPGHWHNDTLLFRFGHLHPFSTIGCRERSSPSMHVVFYKLPSGEHEARVHFDLNAPQNIVGHSTEVLRNRMTFGRTSEFEVYRGLVRSNPNASEPVPEPKYDLGTHTREYLLKAFGPRATGFAIASGMATVGIHRATGWGSQPHRYIDRISTNLLRNATSQTIEFGSSAFLRQDQTFVPQHQSGFSRRMRSAAYRTLFVPGRGGDELAFPRIAAALGTPWVMRPWHPGLESPPNPWGQSAIIFCQYALRSYWAEFKPDILALLRRPARQSAKDANGPSALNH